MFTESANSRHLSRGGAILRWHCYCKVYNRVKATYHPNRHAITHLAREKGALMIGWNSTSRDSEVGYFFASIMKTSLVKPVPEMPEGHQGSGRLFGSFLV